MAVCTECGRIDQHLVNGLCDECAQLLKYEAAVESLRASTEGRDVSDHQKTYRVFMDNAVGNSKLVNYDEIKRKPIERRLWLMLKLTTAKYDPVDIEKSIQHFDRLIVKHYDKIYGVDVDLVIHGKEKVPHGNYVIAEDKEHGISIVKSL